MTEAEIRYEELCKKLGEKEVNYTTTINQMLEQKDIIRRAKETIEAVKAIKDDLESEVELKEEDKKKKMEEIAKQIIKKISEK
jgi:protein subunit release factor A